MQNVFKFKKYKRERERVKRQKFGFTLIELLIVIAIIGLLSSVVLASLNSARGKARDANRAASIKQIQTALEMYYDNNNQYPSSGDVLIPSDPVLTNALTPAYISKISADPSPGRSYHYYTASQNPAAFYAMYVPYETKPICYVCGGDSTCKSNQGWWAVNICQ